MSEQKILVPEGMLKAAMTWYDQPWPLSSLTKDPAYYRDMKEDSFLVAGILEAYRRGKASK